MVPNWVHKRDSQIANRQICTGWIDVTKRNLGCGLFPHQTSFTLDISIKTSNGNVILELAE